MGDARIYRLHLLPTVSLPLGVPEPRLPPLPEGMRLGFGTSIEVVR